MRRKLVERMQINIFKLRLLLVGAHLSVKEMWIFSSKEAARRLAFCPTNRFVCVINIFCLQLVGGGGVVVNLLVGICRNIKLCYY